jgi:pyridoxal phosphate enzyme (YggS family)
MTMIGDKLQQVQARLQAACLASARARDSVRLLAVSKACDAAAVRAAHAQGQQEFGENYVQEAVDKMAALHDLALVWHCIGPIQSNKTQLVSAHFDWVHSVDRLKIAQRLSAQRRPDQAPLQVCLQVNMDGGTNKAGLTPGEVLPLARQVLTLPRLHLRGLMSIPEPDSDGAVMLGVHQRTQALFMQVAGELGASAPHWDTLSMGMSADMEVAVAAGSTLVRVGTAIFGARQPLP